MGDVNMRTHGTVVSGGALVIASVFAFQGCMPDLLVVGNNPGGAGETESGGSGVSAGTGGDGAPAGTGGSEPRAGRPGSGGSGASAGTGAVAPAGSGGGSVSAGSGGTLEGAGTGGGSARAGRGGTGQGGSGPGGRGSGGGSGGRGPGGTGPTAGMGPSGGTGPNAGSGGGGGTPFSFDPACSCNAVADYEFSCTIDLASVHARLTVPTNCDAGLDYVHRNDCVNGNSTYRWVDHGNEYAAGVRAGTLTSLQAVGAVGAICGIDDPIYRTGMITTDPLPPDALPPDQCPLCSACDGPGTDGSTSDLPRCEPCGLGGPSGETHESLEDFCLFHTCPTDLAAAEAAIGATCPAAPASGYTDSTLQTGCGVIAVRREFNGDYEQGYYFDLQTHALVGAFIANDVPWGACGSFFYFGGTVPSLGGTCADASTCTLCTYPPGSVPAGSSPPPPACAD